MSNLPYIFFAIVVLAVMEGVAWFVLRSSATSDSETTSVAVEEMPKKHSQEQALASFVQKEPETISESENFPAPSTEMVNGVTERTIHLGVRQYVWEPAIITAKKGELVRLIIHNADVKHGLVIPDLGVYQDIPPDGAVVEFVANKQGTFEFFCSVWCGEGHMEMQGKMVIE